jgi:sugar phosphate isomerase/epimerase
MLAISTAWNYRPGVDIRQMLNEIKATGLNALELGYKLTAEDLAQIIPLLKKMDLKVSSVHNFCPLPDDYPSTRHPSNYYRLSSLDETERKLAVRWTQQAVNTAIEVGAPVVVIHAGTVEMPEELSEKLFKKFKVAGEPAAFDELRERFIAERQKARGPYVDAVRKSLAGVLQYAQDRNIKIGLETRYYPNEIPNDQEIGEFLAEYHHQGLWYWHDVGHAEANQRFGIYNHLECLKRHEKQLLGFHLHGVNILRDHQAPLDGDFNIKSVFPLMKRHHIKVIESHGSATPAQIAEAVVVLKELESHL